MSPARTRQSRRRSRVEPKRRRGRFARAPLLRGAEFLVEKLKPVRPQGVSVSSRLDSGRIFRPFGLCLLRLAFHQRIVQSTRRRPKETFFQKVAIQSAIM